jgi:hypothetical protein
MSPLLILLFKAFKIRQGSSLIKANSNILSSYNYARITLMLRRTY